ncbi:hyperrecombination- protein [Chamberlinius hualienensis]
MVLTEFEWSAVYVGKHFSHSVELERRTCLLLNLFSCLLSRRLGSCASSLYSYVTLKCAGMALSMGNASPASIGYKFDLSRQLFVKLLKNLLLETDDINSLYDIYNKQSGSATDKKTALEQAFKDVLFQVNEDGKNFEYEKILKLAIDACNKDICNATLPVLLLNDMFDVNTIESCEKLFIFVENHVDTWKQNLFFNSSKNSLLRMCNDLLRRLSRSQNTVFCGRILLFLAKYFPLSERSGLNVASEFNFENATIFGAEDDIASLSSFSSMNEDQGDDLNSEPPEKIIKVDYNLYRKFWALQDFFRNPNQCYNKISWRTFISHSDEVLNTFMSFKLDDVTLSKSRLQQQNEKGVKQPVYFAKYLTNPELLDLQLSDSNFRRYVLIQFLILFQYLNSGVKFKLESYQITEEQGNSIKATNDKIYKLLEETPPDGVKFAKTISHILRREEFWSTWKNEGCPDIGQTASESVVEKPTKPIRQKRSAGEELRAATSRDKYLLGNPSLTKLWNLCPDNMAACRSQKRDFLPSMESFFEEAIEQTDPANMIEDEYKLVQNSNYGWRALRLLACRSPHFFTPSNQPISKLPLYLETMIKKVANEMPQTVTDDIKSDPVDKSLEENGAEESEDELLKNTEEHEESCPTEQNEQNGTSDETESVNIYAPLPVNMIDGISNKLGSEWKKVAPLLGYEKDEIAQFEGESSNPVDQATKMLTLWRESNDENATPKILMTALKSAGMADLADKIFKDT